MRLYLIIFLLSFFISCGGGGGDIGDTGDAGKTKDNNKIKYYKTGDTLIVNKGDTVSSSDNTKIKITTNMSNGKSTIKIISGALHIVK